MDGKTLRPESKYTFWVLLVGVVGVHLLAYHPWYKLPHSDLFFVMHVINNIWNPVLFGTNWLTEFLMSFHTQTAPIYYYGLAYPLRILLPAKWVILTLGFVITLVSGYFAGRPWKHWKHALVATFLVLVLLSVTVSPIEGNKRSFTAVFVIVALGMGSRPNYLKYLFLTGLAAGVYAPVGLILIGYYTVGSLDCCRMDRDGLGRAVVEVVGLCGTFLAVLTPYWSRVFLGAGRTYVTSFVDTTAYTLTSFEGLVKTFLIGSRGTHYGALFMQQQHFDLFLVVVLLGGLQYWLLRSDFVFSRRYGYMVLSVLGLWVLAHLLFPLIYFPFKYTRLALPVTFAFPAISNLPATITRLRDLLRGRTVVRWMLHAAGLISLGVFVLRRVGVRVVSVFREVGSLGGDSLEFLFLLPVLLSLSIVFPRRSNQSHVLALLVVLLLAGLEFMPRNNPTFFYRGAHLSQLEGLIGVLESSPPGSRIAGPPDLMMPVMGFGKRAVFNSPDWRTNDILCRRNEAYWNVLYASEPSTIREFMVNNNLRYFLVDRQLLKRRDFFATKGCLKQFNPIDVSDPYLDRRFRDVEWESSGGRFFLITLEDLPVHPVRD